MTAVATKKLIVLAQAPPAASCAGASHMMDVTKARKPAAVAKKEGQMRPIAVGNVVNTEAPATAIPGIMISINDEDSEKSSPRIMSTIG